MTGGLDLDAVAARAAKDAGGLDPALLGDFLPTVVAAAESGRRLRRAELTRCGARGAQAAAAGVALRALIDLYLSAAWRLWRDLPVANGEDAERIRAAGLAVLRAVDDGVAAVAEGFQLARNDLSRRRQSARRELFDALLIGGPVASAMLGRAADLGLDLAAPHAALVAEGEFESPAAAALPAEVERALQGRHGDAAVLADVKGGRLVCVFAAPDAEALRWVAERVAAVLDKRAAFAWRATTGRAAGGVDGVRVSYEQALDALELAQRLSLPGPLIDPADLGIYRVLFRDREALQELIDTRLGPLRDARGGPQALLETLDAYFATGANSTETARRLHLSVRAVSYRLARVAELLGVDPTDPAERYALQTAVIGARMLGWPG